MEKLIACFEISSSAIKVLIGYELGGSPVVLYRAKKEVPGLIRDGQISDPNGLLRALSEFHTIQDENAHLHIEISEICFLFPPIGLMVYESDKTTSVVAPTNEVGRIDVTNVTSLVRKENVPGGNVVVDIIPDEFILDDGTRYTDPPLGRKSSSLTIRAKIHTLSEAVANTYNRLVVQAGYHAKKASVSTYCIAELFKTYKDLPQTYLLVDMGARLTSVALIGNGSAYAAASFYNGDDLTEQIAQAFECTFAEAEKLKTEYGYRPELRSYEPPLPFQTTVEKQGQYQQKHLNEIIGNYYESYLPMLSNAVSSLFARYGANATENLPLILTGGASSLIGIEGFIAKAFPNRSVFYVTPRSIGARDRGYAALLGMLITGERYVGSLEDARRGMGGVSRVSKEKKPGRVNRSSPESDIL